MGKPPDQRQRFPLRRQGEFAPAPAGTAPPPPPAPAPPPPRQSPSSKARSRARTAAADERGRSAAARAAIGAAPPPPEPDYDDDEPLELTGGIPAAPRPWSSRGAAPPPPPPPYYPAYHPAEMQPGGYTSNLPVLVLRKPRNYWRWAVRGMAGCIVLFVIAVAWLALTAPLSKSLQPPAPPSITLLSADGKPIARRGADIGEPVDAAKLPPHVRGAFVAIEDRRFYSHWGVDARGTVRALVNNMTSGRQQGGSTITQQLAKNAFLDSSRTFTRKFQEALIAFWLEGWLSKDEILSRYLSNVYFGDNAYGLSAAANHYFSTTPDRLTLSQATLLAGLVQAPSRLSPTGNLKGARDRQKLVIAAMANVGLLTPEEAAAVRPAVLKVAKERTLPTGTYFADWVLPQARDRAGGVATEQTVRTTLEVRAQDAAERAVRNAGLKSTQIALVAMHPDGRVIAMVGGNSYAKSSFNRATQARRQPGSAFKLFVYLAALRSGMQPDSIVDDTPVTIGGWSPANSHDSYEGKITLARAFAKSSNVVAAKLFRRLGSQRVIAAARDLGISTPIGTNATTALGTSEVSLLELTAAYASVARGAFPVRPQGLAEEAAGDDPLGALLGNATRYPAGELEDLRTLLKGVTDSGTGRSARLSIATYGKTGTTQDNRDALFVGYAGNIVAGVWMGNDDSSSNAALSGGGLPARVWRDFMQRALELAAAPPPPVESNDTGMNLTIDLDDAIEGLGSLVGVTTETEVDSAPGGTPTPRPTGTPAAREDATVPRRIVVPEPTRTPVRVTVP